MFFNATNFTRLKCEILIVEATNFERSQPDIRIADVSGAPLAIHPLMQEKTGRRGSHFGHRQRRRMQNRVSSVKFVFKGLETNLLRDKFLK
jgi:hypothetical protein